MEDGTEQPRINHSIVSFEQSNQVNQTLLGGKGKILARLYRAGYPVPDGFVILPAAFTDDSLIPEAGQKLLIHLQELRRKYKNSSFAVRSSAINEDSTKASFAGEFETILNMSADQETLEAIHTVRLSRKAKRVQAYSQAQGLEVEHEIAVVVQLMVQPEMAGVLFTADPVRGDRGVMVGNFVHGLGESLVSGKVSNAN